MRGPLGGSDEQRETRGSGLGEGLGRWLGWVNRAPAWVEILAHSGESNRFAPESRADEIEGDGLADLFQPYQGRCLLCERRRWTTRKSPSRICHFCIMRLLLLNIRPEHSHLQPILGSIHSPDQPARFFASTPLSGQSTNIRHTKQQRLTASRAAQSS